MIGVIVGMTSEARLVPDGCRVHCAGGRPARARALADQLLAGGAAGLISFGIAGGLDPALRPGALIIPDRVMTAVGTVEADPEWRHRLRALLPGALPGAILGADDIAAPAEGKARLFHATGALAVDLESASVALACRDAGRPYAVIRTVADPADRDLPSLVADALTPDGRPQPMKVAAGLLRRPFELPALIAVGRDSGKALSALRAAVGRLGPAFGLETA
ncbi:MAG: nucleoside phosphorylase [Telmatospirillum sp.]|nr:nucleoside phosphorylase [Telmatospirillum sp.]